MEHFSLNNSVPKRLFIVDTATPKSVTRTFSVVADYGWAESILCSECYHRHAESIAAILATHLNIPWTTK